MGIDADGVKPDWVLVMDTGVLLCYFEHLGYVMKNEQCRYQKIEDFKETVCRGRRKIILDACRRQIDDCFYRSYPEVLRQDDETWRGYPRKGGMEPPLKVKNADPADVLARVHRSLRDEFEPFKIRITLEMKRPIRDAIRSYLIKQYLNNPKSEESAEWIHAKRHSLRSTAADCANARSVADSNRIKIRHLISEMMKNKDLDMLVQAQIMTERDSNLNVLFVSGDVDHARCRPHMWNATDRRLLVLSPQDAARRIHDLRPRHG